MRRRKWADGWATVHLHWPGWTAIVVRRRNRVSIFYKSFYLLNNPLSAILFTPIHVNSRNLYPTMVAQRTNSAVRFVRTLLPVTLLISFSFLLYSFLPQGTTLRNQLNMSSQHGQMDRTGKASARTLCAMLPYATHVFAQSTLTLLAAAILISFTTPHGKAEKKNEKRKIKRVCLFSLWRYPTGKLSESPHCFYTLSNTMCVCVCARARACAWCVCVSVCVCIHILFVFVCVAMYISMSHGNTFHQPIDFPKNWHQARRGLGRLDGWS